MRFVDVRKCRGGQERGQYALTGGRARTAAATAEVAVLEQQLKQAQLTAVQSNDDAQGRVGQAEASLTAAEADLTQQEASLKLALFDKDAYTRLVQTGAVSERQGKVSVSTSQHHEAAATTPRRPADPAPAT